MSEQIRPMNNDAFLKIDAEGHIIVQGWCFEGHVGSHREAVLRLVEWALDKAYNYKQ